MHNKPFKGGQGSIEYLMIIAVVLVIGLIVIGLSLFFTSTSGELVQTEIDTYWATQVRPIRVLAMEGYYYNSQNGEIALVLQNVDNKQITLKNILLYPNPDNRDLTVYTEHSPSGALMSGTYGNAGPGYVSSENLSIEMDPSEKVTIYIRGKNDTAISYFCDTNSGSSDTIFYKNLTFYYDTPYFTGIKFTGEKPITGKCNDAS